MSALLLLFIPFLLLLRNKHTFWVWIQFKKLLNKFLEYFHVAKKMLLKQPSPLTFKSYITLDFLMVPRTVKFTSRNGIKTHPEMEKERGGKSHPVLVALVQRSVSSLLYKHPSGFAQGMAWKWDTPISATHSPGSSVLPEQGLQPRPTLALFYISMQRNYSWQLLPSILNLTQSKAESEHSTSHLSRFAFQFTSLSHWDLQRLSSGRWATPMVY